MSFTPGTIIREIGARRKDPHYLVQGTHLDDFGDLCYKITRVTETGLVPVGEWYVGYTDAKFEALK